MASNHRPAAPGHRPILVLAALAVLATGSSAQNIERVYNRDSQEQFKLKGVDVKTRVMGPIVRNNTVYTYDNPFKKLTEASVWFNLDPGAVLGAFAYWYKNEYVPGVLMDKNKAWFIYTAITSRNRDPGIMEQYGPQSYHAQIYPLAIGYDLRVELQSVGFLKPEMGKFVIPGPSHPEGVPYERTIEGIDESRVVDGSDVPDLEPGKEFSVDMHAQKFKDRKLYVAGIVRGPGGEVPKIKGLRDVFYIDSGTAGSKAFVGWTRRPTKVYVKHGDYKKTMRIRGNQKGPEAAKLSAHQRLVQGTFKKRSEALNFSLKYGVPSATTALLAVPKEEMELFRKKAAEWNKQQREMARREREWAKNRKQNWRSTRGGDPEIRVHFPNAEKVYAQFPDGRVLELKPAGDGYWGGSYDIPVTAREGEYKIRVVAIRPDGKAEETEVEYFVDRTPPQGTVTAALVDGMWEISVRTETELASVIAQLPNGEELKLAESETDPGLYTARLPANTRSEIKIVLLDKAHNRTELQCSLR